MMGQAFVCHSRFSMCLPERTLHENAEGFFGDGVRGEFSVPAGGTDFDNTTHSGTGAGAVADAPRPGAAAAGTNAANGADAATDARPSQGRGLPGRSVRSVPVRIQFDAQ